MSKSKQGPVYKSSLGFDIKPVTGRFTGTRDKSITQLRAGVANPEPREGGHDPELTGSENAPMTRREHFDQGAWWGDDPFKGIPQADNTPF